MKYVVIGDIHGHDSWKEILKREKDYDKVIFLGDYLDSFTKKPEAQLRNLQDIMNLDDKKTIRLLGNHDYHYVRDSVDVRYSGYNHTTCALCKDDLLEAIKNKKIKILHVDRNVIFSHAGVSQYWFDNVANVNSLEDINFDIFDIKKLDYNLLKGYDPYGDTISQSPIWIRPRSLMENPLSGYKQIVGHTHMYNYMNINDIHLFDSMGDGYYGLINIDEDLFSVTVKKL